MPKSWAGHRAIIWVLSLIGLAAITALFTALICWGFGWWGPGGLSDGLFVVGLGEIVVAGGCVWGSNTETSGGLAQRTLAGVRDRPGSTDFQQRMSADILQRQSVAFQALGLGLLTILVAIGVSLFSGG